MKRITFLLVCLGCAGLLFGQYAYQDAIGLSKKTITIIDGKKAQIPLKLEERERLKKIYGETIIDASNPFIEIVPDNIRAEFGAQKFETAKIAAGGGQGISIPIVADAVAKFLVERAKEELSVAFFEKFAQLIREDKMLNSLFPRTADALAAMKEEIYQYSAYIEILREAMKADAKGLWERMPLFFEQPEVERFFRDKIFKNQFNIDNNYIKFKKYINTALYFINGLVKESPAGVLLENFDIGLIRERNDSDTQYNIINFLRLSQILSTSLRADSEKSSYWEVDELKKMLGSQSPDYTKKRLIYFGLLYELIRNDKKANGDSNSGIRFLIDKQYYFVKDYLVEIPRVQQFVQNLVSSINELESVYQEIQEIKKKNENSSFDKYLVYADAYLKIFVSGFDIVEFLNEGIGQQNDVIKKKITELRQLTQDCRACFNSMKNICIGVIQKNYSLALFSLVNIWNPVMDIAIITSDPNNRQKIEEIRQTVSKTLFRYCSFIAGVSNATNSDEVKKVIESIALPSGSYSVKRNARFNLALNAFVGLAVEHEWSRYLEKTGSQNSTQAANSFLISVGAPIGIAASLGNVLCHGSLSLFASLIDPGALVAYRFSSLENPAPEFSLKNIVSPGLFIIWGLAKCPISIGAGVRFGPELRSVTSDPQTNAVLSDIREKSLRITFFLGVDIPLLNFSTR